MPLEEAHFKKCAIYGATKVYPKNHMAPILRLWCVDPLKRVHGASAHVTGMMLQKDMQKVYKGGRSFASESLTSDKT